MKHKVYILIIFFAGLLSSCNSDFWYDFLLGPQPNFIDDSQIEPSMNVLGILRPDSIDLQPMSFVLVEKMVAAVSTQPDSFNILDAVVEISLIDQSGAVETYPFYLDSAQLFPSIYRPVDFSPQPGKTYRLHCEREGLPTITSETTLPFVPILTGNLINVNQQRVSFSIEPDPTVALYDVYLFSDQKVAMKRVVMASAGATPIEMTFNFNLSNSAYVAIYAYDPQLAEYITFPNVFIKPNTYRPPFTNVSGGYGAFGSMNMLVQPVF